MNRPENFEEQLKRTPMRSIPSDWKTDILSSRSSTKAVKTTSKVGWKTRLQELLWPSPIAWASLAAIWMILIAAQLNSDSSQENQVLIASSAKSETTYPKERNEESQETHELLVELGIAPEDKKKATRQEPSILNLPDQRTEYRKHSFEYSIA